ncbi:MAG: hypothetical protein KJ676_11805 [Alphaproteobacteria bacterium]|nr:hypothetical protein [Alphaproteobacteria bacterium]
MTPPGLAPVVDRRLCGPFATATVDFAVAGRIVERDGWVVAADMRLDAPGDEGTFLEGLARHGADFPDRIDGDFAVALWDQARRTLWLGRDFIGARPLVWTWKPGQWLAFSSLPKGLHGADLASRRPDPVAQAVRLRQSFFRGGDSGFLDVAYVPAGHSLRFGPGDEAPRLHRAYRPDPGSVGAWRGTPQDAADALRGLIDAAVKRRLPAGGLAASHLSGGLDSSAITVLAARGMRARGGRVLALSMTTARAIGPGHLDERPLIDAVLAQEPDVEHVVAHDALRLPGQEEEPDWPGGLVGGPDDQMMARAAASGATRVLSGVGGDEGATYNGANLYAALLRAGRVGAVARELPARARVDRVSLHAALFGRLLSPLRPRWVRRPSTSPMDPTLGVLRFLKPAVRHDVLSRSMPPILQTNSPRERVTAFTDHHIPSRCAYFAIMAARHGIAVSFPLLDRKVVDFMLSLPLDMFVSDGYARQPFRRAMKGILPDQVRLAQVKVGLFDQRFVDYAARKDDLLRAARALRASPSADDIIFDLDAVIAGLESLPGADSLDRATSGGRLALAPGTPPWLPLMAVECLIAAHRATALQTGPGAPEGSAPRGVDGPDHSHSIVPGGLDVTS